jgi:hypothetical protein
MSVKISYYSEEIMDNLGKIIPSVVFEAVNYLLKNIGGFH